MNDAHLHLVLTHLPIVGIFFSIGLLAFGLLRKDKSIINVAHYAIILVAILVIPTFFTGEGAEEVIEKIDASAETFLEEHEKAGKIALIATLISGVFAALSLFMQRKNESSLFPMLTLSVSIVAAVCLARAGNLGGEVRHTEIRSTNTTMPSPSTNRGQEGEEKDND